MCSFKSTVLLTEGIFLGGDSTKKFQVFGLDYTLILLSVSRIEDTSTLSIKADGVTPDLHLRRYLNCLNQEDPRLIEDLKLHYIR